MQIKFDRKLFEALLAGLLIVVAGHLARILHATPSAQAKGLNLRKPAQATVSNETYKRVLDILFSRDVPNSKGSLWAVVIRFVPNAELESQIIIRRDVSKDLGVELVEYLAVGKSIYTQLNEALATREKEDAVELSELIKVQKHKVSLSDVKARKLMAPFFNSLLGTTKKLQQKWVESDTLGTESIHLHGTFYELRYEQGLSEMSLKLLDKETGKPASQYSEKLVHWMQAIKYEAGLLRSQAER